MKATQLIILAVVMVLSSMTDAALGQGRVQMDPEERALEYTQLMTDSLKLGEHQVLEVYDINLKTFKKMNEVFTEASGDREQMRSGMMKINEERNIKFQELLTADQWTKYEKLLEEQRQQRRGGSG